MAICRYLEELHPEPSLMGRDAKERAVIEMWNRRVEIDGFVPAMHALRNADILFEGKVLPGTRNDLAQVPEITERGKASLTILLERLDPQLADNPFIAGETFSIADITGFFSIRLASRIDFPIPGNCPNVARWYTDGRRPAHHARLDRNGIPIWITLSVWLRVSDPRLAPAPRSPAGFGGRRLPPPATLTSAVGYKRRSEGG